MNGGMKLEAQSPGTAHADLGFWLQSQIMGQPMAMGEQQLNVLVQAIAANRFSLPRNRSTGARITEKGTAILEIHGVLINRSPVMGSFWGLTAYEGLGEQFRRLASNSDVKRIVLDIDSPGGMVSGIRTCTDALEELADKKPVFAIAHDMACSAGYWLGCIAEEFSTTPDGDVGSIGVRSGHVSYAQLLDRAGIDIRLFGAGAAKNDHAFSELLTDGAAAEMQYTIERMYDRFVAHVARHRPLSEDAVRDTDARCFVGQDAVSAGLADRVETLEAMIERVEKDAKRTRPNRKKKSQSRTESAPANEPEFEPIVGLFSSKGDRTVSDRNNTGAEQRPGNYDAAIAAALTTLAANATKSGEAPSAEQKPAATPAAEQKPAAEDPKARIEAILLCEDAKERSGLANHLAFKTDMPSDQALAILKAAPAEGKKPDAEKGGDKGQLGSALEQQMAKAGNSAGVKPEAGGESSRPSFAAWVSKQPGSKKTA